MKTLTKLFQLSAILIGVFSTLALSLQAQTQDIITTVAGGGPNGIPAVNANLNAPTEVVPDTAGNLYLAASGQYRVFKISTAGVITVIAGTGSAGYSGDNGPAVDAEVGAVGVAVDGANPANVYVSDTNNCLIRRIDGKTGIITTIAGVVPTNGSTHCGYSGDGGAANAAQIYQPLGLAVNPHNGDVYVAEQFNFRIRKIAGGTPTGTISTVAGNGDCGATGDGGSATSATLCYPQGVAIDASVTPANVFIGDPGHSTVREVVGSSGNIYTVAGNGTGGFIDNVIATSGELNSPWGVSASINGSTTTVQVADENNNRIRQFSLTYKAGVPQPGTITTVAGDGSASFCGDSGLATSACIFTPIGVSTDSSGNIYIGDENNDRIRKVIKSSGDINTVAGWGNVDYSPNIYYSNPNGITGAPGTGLSFYLPGTVLADPASTKVYLGGNATPGLYIWDSSTGKATSFAGNGTFGFAGDGSLANSPAVELNLPDGLAKDAEGNIYIADNLNCAVREVSASTNKITTIVGGSAGQLNGCGYSGDGGKAESAQLNAPTGIIFDANGNMYISEYNNCSIRKVAVGTNIISTVVGNRSCGYNGDGILATNASLNGPQSVGMDGAGNIYIPESGNSRIRKVDAGSGIISTIAGTGTAGYSGDGFATANSIDYPDGIFADANGNVFFPDYLNNLVRWIDPAGQMVSFAGTPLGNGFGGDGGKATSALLSGPDRISVDSEGNFYFADYSNGRFREVTAFAGYGRSSATLDFGEEQPIGTTSGFEPLTLSAVGPTEFTGITMPAGFTEVDDCVGASLTAGQTCEVDVYFTPTKGGITTGTLSIASNAYFNGKGGLSAQGNTVALTGSAVGLTASPTAIVYPNQLINVATAQTVTITNTGAVVTLEKFSVPGSASFTITGGTCTVGEKLATGKSCTVQVTFQPATVGVRKYALEVASSDPASPLLVSVAGTATTVTPSPTSLAFGTVNDGTSSVLNVTVTNSTGSFTISPTVTAGAFTILTNASNTCGTAIPAGASCTLPVQFAPTAGQAYSGTLTLVSGAGTASPTVALTGTGSTSTVSVTPATIAFGSVATGSSATTDVTVKNLGTASLTISTAFSGSGAGAYHIAGTGDTCTGPIAAGASCVLPVKFEPTADESYPATLTITTNGGSNPTVTITGAGS